MEGLTYEENTKNDIHNRIYIFHQPKYRQEAVRMKEDILRKSASRDGFSKNLDVRLLNQSTEYIMGLAYNINLSIPVTAIILTPQNDEIDRFWTQKTLPILKVLYPYKKNV